MRSSLLDETLKLIDESSSQLKANVESLKQKVNSCGSDEWCQLLSKITFSMRQMSSNDSTKLSNEEVEKLRCFAAVLGNLNVGDVHYKGKDELVEVIGRVALMCPNIRVQKLLVDIAVSWVKSDWLLTSTSLFPLLKLVATQVSIQKRVADIKNLSVLSNTAAYAIRCSEDTTFINELYALSVSPIIFQHQDAKRFTVKLFEQTPDKMHEQMKIMLSGSDKKLGKAVGELYFRCLSTFSEDVKTKFLEDCVQDLAYWSLCMPSENLSQTLVEAMVFLNKKMKVTKQGTDDLFDIYSPFLLKMTEVPNSVFRRRAARLLFTVFPLSSTKSPATENEDLMLRQLEIFERLLEDDVPSVRAVSICGLCEMSSCIAEALPTGWLQKILGKTFVRLAFDTSSPDVRLACVKGLGRIVENHVLWPLAERLFGETKMLLHDKSPLVRVAFAQLMDKIAKLHAFKPWKHLSTRSDFLPRLATDDISVCRPLASLLLEVFLSPDKDAVSHLDTCVNVVEANPVAARNFYRIAITQLTFVRAAAFLDILLRHLAIKSAKSLKKMEADGGDCETTLQSTAVGPGDVSTFENSLMGLDSLLELSEIAAVCWLALLPQLRQNINASTTRDLERLAATALPRIFKLCEHYRRDASVVVLLASCLPWRVVPVIFQKTVGFLRHGSSLEEQGQAQAESTDAFRKTSSVAIRALTNWAKLSEPLHIIHESIREGVVNLRKKCSLADQTTLDETKRRSTRKKVRFDKAKAVLSKGGAEQASGVGLEGHLSLLDVLLRNRGCVRQLHGKEAQLRDIWEELKSAFDLIKTAAASPTSFPDDVNRQLLLTFEFYCRIGLFLSIDNEHTPVTIDDGFLRQLTDWLKSNTNMFSGGDSVALSDFHVSICRIYLEQLTTRLMLDVTSLPAGENKNCSGAGPTDIFEMALDAIAFIPKANRMQLGKNVICLIYAAIVKLATLNSRLTEQERAEPIRTLMSYLTVLVENEQTSPEPGTITTAADCLVLLALLSKQEKRAVGFGEVEADRISVCYGCLVSLIFRSINFNEMDIDEENQAPRRRGGLKADSTNMFISVFSRLYAPAVRSIFLPYISILDQHVGSDCKTRATVSRWLKTIGYDPADLPPALSNVVELSETEKPCEDTLAAVG